MAMMCLTIGAKSLTRVKGGVAFAALQLVSGSHIIIMEAELDEGKRELRDAYRDTQINKANSGSRCRLQWVQTNITIW